MVFPVCVVLFIYPSFNRELTKVTENDAIRVGRHLTSSIIPDQTQISRDLMSNTRISGIHEVINDFGLTNLKLFSKSGECYRCYMDIQMPEMSSIEATLAIRELETQNLKLMI